MKRKLLINLFSFFFIFFVLIEDSDAQNLLDTSTWTVGSGSVGEFSRNGEVSENVREFGTDPFGNSSILWKGGNDAASNADGGWNSSYYNIDNEETYRFVVWLKKTNSNDGHSYFGCQQWLCCVGYVLVKPLFFFLVDDFVFLITVQKTNTKMNISIGNDHAGTEYKFAITDALKLRKINVKNYGTNLKDSVDYPDFVHPVAKDISEGKADFGILICGSANGVAMTANKYQKVRAGICWSREIVELIRQHNNANILCIPARFTAIPQAIKMVEVFLKTEFEGGRHQRRVEKISACL